jgi:hypothetical protein
VVFIPVPVVIIPPGLRVNVQVLIDGRPVNIIDPVEEVQVGCIMLSKTGAGGAVFGSAVPLPGRLVQPFTVVVTVYDPAVLTVMDAVDSPVLQSKVPAAAVVRVEVPLQLFVTATTGAAGVVLGAAVPLPGRLVQPFTVVVTVYDPAVVTIIDDVDSPVLQSKVPAAAVVRVEVPLQLFVTATVGAGGVILGAAVPLPGRLVQPLIVVVTVYGPAVVTVIDDVDSPVLQSNVPVAAVVRVEVPSQLSVTDTTGAAGVVLGAAVPLPGRLVQPFTVVVTVYDPAVETIIEDVVAPVLHRRVPAAAVVSVEVPLQLSVTFTTGVAGAVFGAAVPLPGRLVQPSIVVVTVYDPAVVTVMDDVDAPVLHSKVPAAPVVSVEVPLQLSVTLTTGAAGVVLGAAVPLPGRLVQPSMVVVTVYEPAVVTVMDAVDAPVLHSRVPAAAVVRVEVPLQLSVTATAGAAGVVLGAAVPLPGRLVQPLIVVVTVYDPAVVTVMDAVDSPVLQSKVPAAAVVRVEVPLQLSVTDTTGAVGVVFTMIVMSALFEQLFPSVYEYDITCDPLPAVPGSNSPELLTPVPLNIPPPGSAISWTVVPPVQNGPASEIVITGNWLIVI